jgi:hypothetical protein
LLIHH